MNRFNKFLVAAFLSAALLLPNILQAMTFPQFDHMAKQDRQDFLDSLSRDAETVLKQEGRSADAQKAHHLFNDIRPGDNLPVGEAEVELNLDNIRVQDEEKHIQNPDARRMQVETALAVTLSKNGIQITPDFAGSFMQLTSTFKPKLPPLSVSVGEAISQAAEIREGERGVIKDAMGDGEKKVELDLGTEDDEYRIGDAMLLPGSAQAMTFPQFDAMANQDRQDFLDSLSRDAETVLKQEGRSADALKVHHLFNDFLPGDSLPIGEAELELNLANGRVADAARSATEYPNLPRILVEAAMAVTLKKNGIELSPNFLKDFEWLVSAFKPKLPPNEAGVEGAERAVSQLPHPAPAAPVPPPASPTDDDPMGGDGGFITPPAH